jgi:ketosteroid isomerase-like protein
MSQDDEAIVRAAYEGFNAGGRIPTLDFWHADGVYATAREDPDSETHHGIEAVSGQFRRWVDAYPDLRVEPVEIRSRDNRVFLWVRFSGHGANSDVPIEMELAHVVTIDEGKIRRIEEYFERSEGLAAAGLSD